MKTIKITREEAISYSKKFSTNPDAKYFIGQDDADAIWGEGNTKDEAISDAIKNIRECCTSQDLMYEDENGDYQNKTDKQLLEDCAVMEVVNA